MADAQRSDSRCDIGNGRQGHYVLVGALHIERVQGAGTGLILWRELHHDPVFVRGTIDRADLLTPIGAGQGGLNLLGRHPVRRGRLAPDGDLDLGIVERQIAARVLESRDLA